MYSNQQRERLLDLAAQSIAHGCRGDDIQSIQRQLKTSSPTHALKQVRACFVSLHKGGELRGCIGSLEPYQPLIEDVINNAYSAAFRDRRFSPVTEEERALLDIEISVLSPIEPVKVNSEAELLSQLQPDRDGLIVDDQQGHRATFLPQVWEQLPTPEDFLTQLRRKAGISPQSRPENLQWFRYHCEAFHKLTN